MRGGGGGGVKGVHQGSELHEQPGPRVRGQNESCRSKSNPSAAREAICNVEIAA